MIGKKLGLGFNRLGELSLQYLRYLPMELLTGALQ